MSELEQIEHLEQEILTAIKKQDVDSLFRVLAPDFLYRSPGAEQRDRNAFLEGIRNIPGRIEEIDLREVHTRVFADTAVVTGVQVALVRLVDDSLVESRVAFTDVFHRDAEWQLSLAYGVELPTGTPEDGAG